MNAPTRPAGALVVLALLASCSHPPTKESLDLAGRLYQRSGLEAQLRSVPGQFEQGLADYRGKVPDETIAALADAGKKSFAPDALRGEIVQALAGRLTAAEIRQTLAWLEGPVGARVTRAEENAAASMTPEAMQAFFQSERGKPADPRRETLIAGLIEATRAVEIGASFIEAISLGMAAGMDATQPAEKRIGAAGLRERLRAAVPPQKLRADVGAMLPPMYRYIYRGVSNEDLAAYVEFNRSPLGARYNEAVTGALAGAMTRASVRVGETLPAAPAKDRI
jgi:uncharacterized protein DUF2059